MVGSTRSMAAHWRGVRLLASSRITCSWRDTRELVVLALAFFIIWDSAHNITLQSLTTQNTLHAHVSIINGHSEPPRLHLSLLNYPVSNRKILLEQLLFTKQNQSESFKTRRVPDKFEAWCLPPALKKKSILIMKNCFVNLNCYFCDLCIGYRLNNFWHSIISLAFPLRGTDKTTWMFYGTVLWRHCLFWSAKFLVSDPSCVEKHASLKAFECEKTLQLKRACILL